MTQPDSITRRSLVAGAAGAAALTVAAAPVAAARPRRTARVIVGGHVFTGTAQRGAEAVAIGTDGRIQAVGSTREIRRLADRRTDVLHADGGTIMAGIHDGHMHALGAAEQGMNPSLGNVSMTVPELQSALQGFLDATSDAEPDGWLQVTDWSPVGLLPAGTVADRSMLDAPTRRDRSSSRARTSTTPGSTAALSPSPGSTARRRTRPAVRSCAVPAASRPASSRTTPRDSSAPSSRRRPGRARGCVRRHDGLPAQPRHHSFMDGASDEASVRSYADLRSAGHLLQSVTPALRLSSEHTKKPQQAAEWLAHLRRRHGKVPGIHITTAKVFVDGVIEYPAQTAALLDPYLDEDGRPTRNRGDLYLSSKEYQRLAVVLDAAGWQLHSHAIGDRAVRVALDAYEAALHANGRRARRHRHTVAHLQLVHPRDYPRFKEIGALACMQLQWAVRNEWTLDALRPFIGDERFRRMYPARSLERAGARLVGGSDWPVDPLRPFNQIATAIDRTQYDAVPRPLNADQAISRSASLAIHTRGSAFQLHEGRTGTVARGQVADLVVVERDLQKVGPRSIRGASVRTR